MCIILFLHRSIVWRTVRLTDTAAAYTVSHGKNLQTSGSQGCHSFGEK